MVDGMPVAQHTGHGFGTKSIKLAVERMNGNCQFRINGDRFELRAVMWGCRQPRYSGAAAGVSCLM